MITEDLTITVPCPCALIVHRKSGDKMYDEVVIPSWRKSRSKKSPRIVFTTIKLSPEGAEIKLLSPNPLTIAIEISKQLYRFSVSSLLYPEQRETAWKNISAKAIVSMYLTAYRYNSTAAAPLVFKDIETDVWHNIITKEVVDPPDYFCNNNVLFLQQLERILASYKYSSFSEKEKETLLLLIEEVKKYDFQVRVKIDKNLGVPAPMVASSGSYTSVFTTTFSTTAMYTNTAADPLAEGG